MNAMPRWCASLYSPGGKRQRFGCRNRPGLVPVKVRHRLSRSARCDHPGQGPDSALKRGMGRYWKGKASSALYLAGLLSALLGGQHDKIWVYVGVAFFVGVAILWLVPDRRIERSIGARPLTE